MSVFLVLGGLVLLVVGGDTLVRGSVGAANWLGVSPLVTGLVLVGFGTSAPELVTSLSAVVAGSPDIALGNILGSNIANILLVLGLCSVVAPLAVCRAALGRDGPMLALVTLGFTGLVLLGLSGRGLGGLLFGALVAYVAFAFHQERKKADAQARLHAREVALVKPLLRGLLLNLHQAVVGVGLVVAGADFMVDGASALARKWNVPELTIGLTIVAVGTSLPEIATSVAAAARRETDIILGNIVGSNIFNICGGVGLVSLVRPFRIDIAMLGLDLAVMVGATAIFLGIVLAGRRISRTMGLTAVSLYLVYIVSAV